MFTLQFKYYRKEFQRKISINQKKIYEYKSGFFKINPLFLINHLQNICFIAKILLANAGIVQRLECGLAKAKMPVRFRLLAPN